jgi:peptidoglycan/LPS O-acetylase OafA/YrhL
MDLIRIVPMVGVVAAHTVIFTQPVASVGAGALLMVLHANREVFFFTTGFLLFHSTQNVGGLGWSRFWWRRYPLVLVPYLAWTLIYWLQTQNWTPWPPAAALRLLETDLALGWFHLYFLLVTMQLYAVFPLLACLVRRTRGRHWLLLGASVAVQLAFTAFFEYGSSLTPGALQTWFAHAQVEATSYQLAFIAGALAADHAAECLAWVRAHARLALAAAAGAALAAEAWYAGNLAVGRSAQQAADVFQPAGVLVLGAAVVALVVLADWLVRRWSADTRVGRGVKTAARASFGVYLAHMLAMQGLLLTPLGSVIGVEALPLPVQGVAVLALVLGATFALVLTLQRTPLSLILTGRPRPPRPPRPPAPTHEPDALAPLALNAERAPSGSSTP